MPVKKSVLLDEDVFKKIRKIQSHEILKHKEGVSISNIINKALINEFFKVELIKTKN